MMRHLALLGLVLLHRLEWVLPVRAGSFDDFGICLPDGGLADGGR